MVMVVRMTPTRSRLRAEAHTAVDDARRSGAELVVVEPGPAWDPITSRSSDGRTVRTLTGTVHMVNPPGRRKYDYRAVVSFDRSDSKRPRAYVSELTAIRRPGGVEIGARQAQKENIGGILRYAVANLSTFEGEPLTPAGLSEGSRRRLLARDLRRQKGQPRDDELRIARKAHEEAIAKGLPYRAHIGRKLRDAGFVGSLGTVKNRLDELRAAGEIPDARPGRPRRSIARPSRVSD